MVLAAFPQLLRVFASSLAMLGLLIGAGLVASPPASAETASRTQFVIALDRPSDFQVFSLNEPNRVIVELSDVRMQLPPQPGEANKSLVTGFRAGLSAPGRARVVIDVTQPVIVENARLHREGKGGNLVIDIVPADLSGRAKRATMARPFALGATGIPAPLPRPAASLAESLARKSRPVIVIDPGHGGHDSGAMKNGAVEKDVVLAFGLKLRDMLKATGRYEVLMTRDDDSFVPLDERREFAEKHRAALFIAVHADYASSRARGATIYSLRDSMADSLRRSAKEDVASNVLTKAEFNAVKRVGDDVDTVRTILSDLAQREVDVTKERTSIFTRSVIEFMGESTSMRDNPDRSAAFKVLKTAQMPAVLIELAYVSNRQDAMLLQSDEWREKVSGSITTAIDNYFSHQLSRLPM